MSTDAQGGAMPRARSADPRLAAVVGLTRDTGRKHSPLYLWMHQHHARLAPEFAKHGPGWTALVEFFGAEGLTDRTGKPPTVRTAQQTWYRVCKDVAREEAERANPSVPKRIRRNRKPKYEHEPEPEIVSSHPSGKPPDVRLAEAAARYAADQAKRRFPTGKPRALRMPTLDGSAPATEAGEGSVALPRPAMPKPRLIHHQQGENEHGITERDADRD